jgi:hypothetical protein
VQKLPQMAGYSSYSLASVKKQFGLKSIKKPLFETIEPITPSDWLKTTMTMSEKMVLVSEKSRSEWLVAPILMEIKHRNLNKLNILSGENLDADKEQSLVGECDFLFVKDPETETVETPILCLVEAEKHDLTGGLGQCIAQMLGARMLNERDNVFFPAIYGCVTTGSDWRFLKLEKQIVVIEPNLKFIIELPVILGMFQSIVNAFDGM